VSPFLEILYQLSHETGLQLYPDSHAACQLLVGDNMKVQLEMDVTESKLLIGSIIIEIPLGKFRETVLKHALAANAAEYPYYGYLCYIHQLNALALCDALPIKNLTGPQLVTYITLFAEKAEHWYKAISRGQPGPHVLQSQQNQPSPRFGIKS
jgi:hypothetical protein